MDNKSETLSRADVVGQVRDIVVEALRAQKMANSIGEETYLENLGLDSLNIVDVFLGIEQKFGVEFDDEELDLSVLETVGTLADFVMQAKGQAG